MPFTPSHVVAVLPLTTGRRSRSFDTAALTIGAMVPDLPYFVWPHLGARITHAWFGPFTVDLVLGLLVLGVWRAAVPGLVLLAPDWLRARLLVRAITFPELLEGRGVDQRSRALSLADRALSLSKGGTCRLVRAAWSITLGALTHVVWDAFSHAGRWGTRHVAWLAEVHGPLAGYKWVQYGSGVFGLVVLALWLAAWFRRTRPRPLGSEDDAVGRWRRRTWWASAAVLVATVAGTWVDGAVASGRWLDETTAVAVASRTIEVGLALVVAVAVVSRLWSASSGGRPSRTMGR